MGNTAIHLFRTVIWHATSTHTHVSNRAYRKVCSHCLHCVSDCPFVLPGMLSLHCVPYMLHSLNCQYISAGMERTRYSHTLNAVGEKSESHLFFSVSLQLHLRLRHTALSGCPSHNWQESKHRDGKLCSM